MRKWKIRAAQLDLARQKETLEFIMSFIDFIVQYNYNTLVLYLEGIIRTKTFPYPSAEESYAPDEMKEIVRYASKKRIEVIPVISNLGHTEQFLKYPQLKHMAELREGIPGRFGSGLTVICPSLNEPYEFFESYFAEIAAIFPSPYFHVGCDEVWDMALCSLCRPKAEKKGTHSLFAEHILRTHRFLTGRLKKRMMMWDDLFEAYPEALNVVPRDIIMCSWFYDQTFEFPRSHFFNRKKEDVFRKYDRLGFQYLICPREQSITNILSCTRYAERYNPLGGLVTSWEGRSSFLYKYYPVFGFAGLLWSTETDESNIMKKVCRNLFGSDCPSLVNAVELYVSRGPWPKARNTACFISGAPGLTEQTRRAETQLLADMLGSVSILKAKTDGRRIMEDIRTDLAEESIRHAMRTLLPGFFEESVVSSPSQEIKKSIISCVKQLRALAKKRALQWKEWRKAIPSNGASGVVNQYADSLEKLLDAPGPSALIHVSCFVPDHYAAPKTNISLWDKKKLSWETVYPGTLRPMMEGQIYYRMTIPIYKNADFSRIRIDVWNYGGMGFRFIEIITKKGLFIPETVEKTSGIVRNPEYILFDDYRCAYLGDQDVFEAFHNKKISDKVHSITVSLKEEQNF